LFRLALSVCFSARLTRSGALLFSVDDSLWNNAFPQL
jgi:hypothetical protein